MVSTRREAINNYVTRFGEGEIWMSVSTTFDEQFQTVGIDFLPCASQEQMRPSIDEVYSDSTFYFPLLEREHGGLIGFKEKSKTYTSYGLVSDEDEATKFLEEEGDPDAFFYSWDELWEEFENNMLEKDEEEIEEEESQYDNEEEEDFNEHQELISVSIKEFSNFH